jgi:hypothetical protein
MCKTSLLSQMNPSLILDIPVHDLYYFPSADVVGLVEYLCTHPIYICGFLQRKTRTSLLKTLNRGCVRTQPCLWC